MLLPILSRSWQVLDTPLLIVIEFFQKDGPIRACFLMVDLFFLVVFFSDVVVHEMHTACQLFSLDIKGRKVPSR
jgi:hypothetical protein